MTKAKTETVKAGIKPIKGLEELSPGYLKQVSANHQFTPRLSADFKFNTGALDTFAESNVKSLTAFTKARDNPLVKKFFESDNATAIRTALDAALNSDASTLTAARDEYKKTVQAHQAMIADIPAKHSISAVLGVYKETTDTAVAAIKKQNDSQLDAFKKVFDSKEVAGFSPAEIQELKKTFSSELEASQKERQNAFLQTVQSTNNEVHQAQKKQAELFLFLASLRGHDLSKYLDKASGAISAHDKEIKTDDLLRVDLNKITELARLTGKNISVKENPDGTFSCHLDLSARILNPLYYLNNNAEADMLLMASRIKAQGKETLTVNLDFKDENIAMQRAQEAFRAAAKAGFEPKDITINVSVNGKQIGVYKEPVKDDKKNESSKAFDALFEKNPLQYQEILAEGKRARAERQKVIEHVIKGSTATSTEATDEYRTALKGIKEEHAAAAAAKAKSSAPEVGVKLETTPEREPGAESEPSVTTSMSK